MPSSDFQLPRPAPADFATTQWSLVVGAAARAQPDASAALALLCQRYWYPLYSYVRRRVADVNEAQDLTQEFFARLLEKNTLAQASPERGRFRAFLLTAMRNFLANEWDRSQALKRGGEHKRLSLDFDSGESRLHFEPADERSPERIYERQWALLLLELVLQRLAAEFAAAGNQRQFEILQPTLAGSRTASYQQIAQDLGTSEEAARQTAHRLRKRYRELLRAEVRQTIAEPGEVEDEIRSLFEVLGG